MHIGNKPKKNRINDDEEIYDEDIHDEEYDEDEDYDEYDEDDDDDDEGTFIQRIMSSMDLKSWIGVGFGGIVCILFLMFMLQDKKPVKETKDTSPASSVIAKKSTKKSSSSKSKEKSSESSTSSSTETSSEKPDEAKEKIEKTLDSKTPAPQDVLDALNNAVNAAQSDVQTNQMNVQPVEANHLAATHTSMVSTFAMAIVYNGYTVSKTEAYMTNDEGVYQIIITMSAPNKSNLYFNGFYNADQLRLTEYSGGQIGATFG